jgi:hypothetical protein
MGESPTASALKIAERDLRRALGRISDLSALVGEVADRMESVDPRYAREVRNRAFNMAFVDGRGPRGRDW